MAVHCIGVKGGKTHDDLVQERGDNFLDSVVVDFVIVAIGENLGLGLLGKQVIETAPHLLVVLCCALLTMNTSVLDKFFTGSLEGLLIDLTILGDEVNGATVLVLVRGNVFCPFISTHGADFVG